MTDTDANDTIDALIEHHASLGGGYVRGSVALQRAARFAQKSQDVLKYIDDYRDVEIGNALANLANAYATIALACRESFR